MSALWGEAEREKAWLAVLLAWVAGIVDAVGYLTLFRLFTAHMSGNSVELGLRLGQGDWGEALRRAVPVPLFVLGVALGAALSEAAARRGVRSTFALVLAPEAALLLAFMLYGSRLLRGGAISVTLGWTYYVPVALLVLAMGLQTATLQRVAGRTVRTTYVTGMLTNLAQESVTYLFWRHDRKHGRADADDKDGSLQRVVLLASIWSAYALGAILGGYAELHWALRPLLFPLCALAAVVVLDLLRPINTAPGNVSSG